MRKWIIFVIDNRLVFLILSFVGFLISVFLVRDLNVEAFPDPSPPMVEIVTHLRGKIG